MAYHTHTAISRATEPTVRELFLSKVNLATSTQTHIILM